MVDSNKYLEELEERLTAQEIEAEQQAALLGNSDLQEACRQYYFPQWHSHDVLHDGRIRTNHIRTELDRLYAMTPSKRDLIISNRGYWTQAEWEANRQSMAANGVQFNLGSLEDGSTWKLKTMGNRPPYQYLESNP